MLSFPPWMLLYSTFTRLYKKKKKYICTGTCRSCSVSPPASGWQRWWGERTGCPSHERCHHTSPCKTWGFQCLAAPNTFAKSSPTETKFEEVNFERSEWGDQHVEAHVELLSTNQQGIVDVSENNIEQPQLQSKFNQFDGHLHNYLDMT